ncbi:hypothetical protein OG21DRAFT_1524903 [Imleria badia]|nr:hypothetical protein OG21DRAFT_1524903 [Imleria badia]
MMREELAMSQVFCIDAEIWLENGHERRSCQGVLLRLWALGQTGSRRRYKFLRETASTFLYLSASSITLTGRSKPPHMPVKAPDPDQPLHPSTALRDRHTSMAYLHTAKSRMMARGASEGGEETAFISAGGETALRTAGDKGSPIAFERLYKSNVLIRLPARSPYAATEESTSRSWGPVDAGNLTRGYNDWPFADGNIQGID